MAFSRNNSKNDEDVPKDLTEQVITLHSHANGQETQQNTDETCNSEIIRKNCTSHMKHETTNNVDIKFQGTKLYIDAPGFSCGSIWL